MLKQPNTVKDTVISFSTKIPYEFDLHKYVDYDTQFEKTFTDPLKFILDSIGWKLEREATLEVSSDDNFTSAFISYGFYIL